MRLLAGEGLAPRVSWNRPVGTGRRLLLARAKAVAHVHGATVNDLVLTVVAGGARRVLAGRGELRPGLILKAAEDSQDFVPYCPTWSRMRRRQLAGHGKWAGGRLRIAGAHGRRAPIGVCDEWLFEVNRDAAVAR